jgi:hypothetical protein
MKKALTQARLYEVLSYDKKTGIFRWVSTRRGQRPKVGDVAGTTGVSGYCYIGVDRFTYAAHRLAWLYVTGDWPKHDIDHRNRHRSDNRWSNLREATPGQQRQNQSLGSNNKTGFLGVRKHRCGKFEANIAVNGKHRYLGLFTTAEKASAAYLKAKRQLHTFNPE